METKKLKFGQNPKSNVSHCLSRLRRLPKQSSTELLPNHVSEGEDLRGSMET